ncbi:hypothetical protein FOL47_006278 [Perkinsus chesapeaki]|uniref:RING-type domain-containing protein n=1 Tax=Perkinsus chesapeaki TaxID=330153 RepID=A0A7J6LTN9_PERCH|nr:hypothetical protein FOL47_006278 [Perkinsus chesapeaki]
MSNEIDEDSLDVLLREHPGESDLTRLRLLRPTRRRTRSQIAHESLWAGRGSLAEQTRGTTNYSDTSISPIDARLRADGMSRSERLHQSAWRGLGGLPEPMRRDVQRGDGGSPRRMPRRSTRAAERHLTEWTGPTALGATLRASEKRSTGLIENAKFQLHQSVLKTTVLRWQPGGEMPSCCICLENFKSKAIVKEGACGHFYHGQCIAKWIEAIKERSSGTRDACCPYCRQELIKKLLCET